jgi:hypothetical protein
MSRGGTTLYVTVCRVLRHLASLSSHPVISAKLILNRVSAPAHALATLPTNSNGMSTKRRYLDDQLRVRLPNPSFLVLPRPFVLISSNLRCHLYIVVCLPALVAFSPLPRSIERSHCETISYPYLSPPKCPAGGGSNFPASCPSLSISIHPYPPGN